MRDVKKKLAMLAALAVLTSSACGIQACTAEENTDAETAAPTVHAEETHAEQTQSPTENAPATAEATQAPADTATAAPENTAGADATPEVSAEASASPDTSETPDTSASPDASETPDASASPDASETPGEDPDASPSVSPSVSPEPTVAPFNLTLSVNGMQAGEDGVYTVMAGMTTEIGLSWSCDAENVSYSGVLSSLDVDPAVETQLFSQSSDTGYTLSLNGLQAGSYQFRLGAVQEGATGDITLWCSLTIRLTSGMPGGPGGGMSGGGMSGGADGLTEEEQGFHVTPGEALSDSHSSGSGDTALYGTVSLEVSGEPMRQLALGGEALEIRSEQQAGFTACVDAGVLTLGSADDAGEASWQINGYALKTLFKSGIDTLVLAADGRQLEIPTENLLAGSDYQQLCAAGIVSADYNFSFCVNAAGYSCTVEVNGESRIPGEAAQDGLWLNGVQLN